MNIVLKDSFNHLIYHDYTDFLPLNYLKISDEDKINKKYYIDIHFEQNLQISDNVVSSILIER